MTDTTPTASLADAQQGETLKRVSDIGDNVDEIIACGKRWDEVAAKIGCTVRGFNDDFSASFYSPDGNAFDVGKEFRAVIVALRSQPSPAVDDVVYLRDLDGTGSMHACSKGDPGAVEYVPLSPAQEPASPPTDDRVLLEELVEWMRNRSFSFGNGLAERTAYRAWRDAADELEARIQSRLSQGDEK